MKVFISSTAKTYESRRKMIKKDVEKVGFIGVLSEYPDFPTDARLQSSDICIKNVEHCDILILIIQKTYGQKYKGELYKTFYKKLSITHAEYRHAVKMSKKIIILCENEIITELNLWLQDKLKYKGTVDINVFKLYTEINRQKKDNWIFTFKSDEEITSYIINQLNFFKNESISKPNEALRRSFICDPFDDFKCENKILASAYWKITIDNLNSVQKSWNIKLLNNTANDIIIKTSLPLPLQFEYEDVNIIKREVILGLKDITSKVSAYVVHLESTHRKAIVIQPPKEGLLFKSGEFFEILLEFSHTNYFKKISNFWTNTGYMFFLDYPDFKGYNISQKLSKEYYFSREALHSHDSVFGINTEPCPHWSANTDKYYVIGYGRIFEKEVSRNIDITIMLTNHA